MGNKKDKKIKSDRINVLKKQYDAFLEEDKKRKNRNEYILGRLDKMRYNSSAVQLRHTPSSFGGYYPPSSFERHDYRPECIERNDMQVVHINQQVTRPGSLCSLQLDNPKHLIEESAVLKEISKKYILIPKLRTAFPIDNSVVIPAVVPTPVSAPYPENIDNSDWKSKYDILDKLKENENEVEFKYTNKEHLDNEQIRKDIKETHNIDHVMLNYEIEDLPPRYEEEIPEKDTSDNISMENELKILEKCEITEKTETIPRHNPDDEVNALSLNTGNSVANYDHKQPKTIVHDTPEIINVKLNSPPEQNVEQYVNLTEPNAESAHIENEVDYQENYPEQEYQLQQEPEYPIEYEQFIPNAEANANNPESEKVIIHEEENQIEVIDPNELVDEINRENTAKENNRVATDNEYPTEIGDTQQFDQKEVIAIQDTQGINPENYMADDGTIVEEPVPQMQENPLDVEGIEEFDAENNSMFYSDDTSATYYDQQAAGDAYNAEYAQNQYYPQGQKYTYYEGAEQEQAAYPVEINEHEETQQLYDQNYEQQYANYEEQPIDQQTVYMEQDPAQPQFEQPALYNEAQKEFDQTVFNQQHSETREEVEQVLDREDGYVQNHEDNPTTTPVQDDNQTAELNP